MPMKTLTVTSGYHYKVGDIVSFLEPDKRWWKILLSKILFLPPQYKARHVVITQIHSSTLVSYEEIL